MTVNASERVSPGKAIFLLAVGIGMVWWLASRDAGPQAPEDRQAAAAPVDFTKATFTKEGAVSCPASLVLDKRVGHSLQDATNALLGGLFSQDETALKGMGCQLWHDGQPVQVAPGSRADQVWVLGSDGLTLYPQAWLRN